MPRININEIDNTVYSINNLTNDNIVYVPGNMPKGEYRHPVLLTSVEQFENEFGNYSPFGGHTYDYVKGLLLAGLPVLFRRIVAKNQDSDSESENERPEYFIKQATTTLYTSQEVDGQTVKTDQLIVTEKFGGSYGNTLSVTIRKQSQSLIFEVASNGKVIESEKIVTLVEDEAIDRNNEIKFFTTHEFKTVNVALARTSNDPDENAELLASFVVPIITGQVLEGGEDITDDKVKEEIPNSYEFITDKYIYDVKFVTGGGYTNEEIDQMYIAKKQKDLCETRKDCFAILDIPYGTQKSQVNKYFTDCDTSFAASFAPWCYTKLPSGNERWMAPSYLFLYTLGRSIQDGNPVYSAPAGVLKASMPQVIKPEYEIGGDTLDLWQSANPQAINPLMKLRNYGYVIYGQKTLYNIQNNNSAKGSALQEINVRIAMNEIRRILFNAAIKLTFQANNQRTWNEFKALVEPKLQSMVSNGGITDFQVKMDSTTTTQEDLQNNTIRARVSVSVTKAVENFEIDFYIEPQSVKFADEENEKNVLVGGIYQGINNSDLSWNKSNNY